MTYAKKLEYSNNIRNKFSEIKLLKQALMTCINEDNETDYKYAVNVIFSKISVIEKNIINLKGEL